MPPNPPRHGFISYAHDDIAHFKDFRKHIGPVERLFQFQFWTDETLAGGQVWNDEIQQAIARADVSLLLLSNSCFRSRYIWENELPAIRAERAKRNALVIPVILERCMWEALIGRSLDAIPKNKSIRVEPILDWRPQRNGFHAAGEQIVKAIKTHFKVDPAPPQDMGSGIAP